MLLLPTSSNDLTLLSKHPSDQFDVSSRKRNTLRPPDHLTMPKKTAAAAPAPEKAPAEKKKAEKGKEKGKASASPAAPAPAKKEAKAKKK